MAETRSKSPEENGTVYCTETIRTVGQKVPAMGTWPTDTILAEGFGNRVAGLRIGAFGEQVSMDTGVTDVPGAADRPAHREDAVDCKVAPSIEGVLLVSASPLSSPSPPTDIDHRPDLSAEGGKARATIRLVCRPPALRL
ncbi:hypothetical protein GCM10027074_51890 [Streptomyces deserti]